MEDSVFKNRYMLYLATGVLFVCMLYFFGVTFLTTPDSGKRYTDIILGALIGAGFTGIMQWGYGSSKGSGERAATIDKQITAQIKADKLEAQNECEEKKITNG